MTTTSLAVAESSYGIGRRHVHFDVSGSTPTVGAMTDRDAGALFRVISGGFITKRTYGLQRFAWPGTNGQQVKAAAVDREGNLGQWATYTYSVAPNTDADHVFYIDTGGNDTTGDGSIGNPWATATKAVTEAQAVMTSGESTAIVCSDDQVWAHTAPVFVGSNTTDCLIRFVRRGNGTARPKFTFSAGQNGLTIGKRGTAHVDGVDLQGAHTTYVGVAINMARSGGGGGAADQSAWNVMVVDCDITQFGMAAYCNNNVGGGAPTHTDRNAGCFDFIAFQNCQITGSVSYHFYGFFNIRYWLMRDVYCGSHYAPFISGAIRVWSLERAYFDSVTTNTGGGGSMRLLVNNNNIDGALRYCDFFNCLFQHTAAGTVTIGPDPGATGVHYVHDLRFVGCRAEGWSFISISGDASGSNGLNLDRFDMLNCVASRAILLTVTGSASVSHTYNKIRVRQCIASGTGNGFVYLPCPASRLADDCYEFVGNVKISGLGNTGPLFYDCGLGINQADFAAKVGVSDYNQTIKGDANTHAWGYVSGGLSLATWQGTYGHDLNSKQTANSSGNVIDDGLTTTAAAGNFRLLSDSGPIPNSGYPLPLGVAIDAEGYLRSATTPDAGPFEYGASTLPDDPVIGGGGASSTRRRSALSLGLGLR